MWLFIAIFELCHGLTDAHLQFLVCCCFWWVKQYFLAGIWREVYLHDIMKQFRKSAPPTFTIQVIIEGKSTKKSNHILFINLLDCQPPPPNNGMAWHGIIHQFQRLHELIELLHMALLNVELITKLSNVWMDPVSASLGWNPRNGMGTKASSKPLKWRNNMGNHETQNYEPNMLVSGNCCSL